MDQTYRAGETTDVPLGEFLARPVEILDCEWAIADNTRYTVDPWSAFLTDPLVRRRLEGFRHVRGQLKIRIALNGNPTYFGRAIAAYVPRPKDTVYPFVATNFHSTCVQMTQFPHLFLDFSTSEGGELTCPFFCPENWIDLASTDSANRMGELRIDIVATMRAVNTVAANATAHVYAWLENAEVAAPTATSYAHYTPHCGFSGYESDDDVPSSITIDSDYEPQNEYAENPVSKTAATVAKAAGLLSHVPEIAPFMLATEASAKILGGVAHLFGYSRPTVVEKIHRYAEFAYGEMATMNSPEPVLKIAGDVKNELTVDPRTVGLPGTDEMAIKYIAEKECCFLRFNWDESVNIGSSLHSVNVVPGQFSTDLSVSPGRSVLTPTAALSQLFRYWRGSIIYRVHIACSALHRGRIKVSYDPVVGSNSGTNQVYTRIVDIATTRDFEIPVYWHAHTPYLKTTAIPVGTSSYAFGASIPCDPEFCNGQLRFEPATKLTSPDPSMLNNVEIFVSMRAGPDFEFADPRPDFLPNYTFTSTDPLVEPQSLFTNSDDEFEAHTALEHQQENTENINAPEGAEPIDGIGGGEIVEMDYTPSVFMGETITSLRSYAKRMIFESWAPSTYAAWISLRRNMRTRSPSTLEWIMHMYTGWRGSMRVKVYETGHEVRSWHVHLSQSSSLPYTGAFDQEFLNDCRHVDNGKVAMELPWYYSKRFTSCRSSYGYTSSTKAWDDAYEPNNRHVHTYITNANHHCYWIGAGDDFSCFFFVGLPPVYAVS